MPNPETPPDILYKYFPPERTDIFDSWSLRFTHPSKFNDLFDTDLSLNDRRSPRLKLKNSQHFGVLCLTENPDNHLMWVNYAKELTGFVVGFDSSDSFFSAEGQLLGKVAYRDVPPRMLFDSEIPRDLCFVKSTTWEKESEWRCVRTYTGPPQDYWETPLPHTAIRTIILGTTISDPTRTRLFKWADDMLTDNFQIEIRESVADRKTWTFRNIPTKKKLCSCCNGQGTTLKSESLGSLMNHNPGS